MVLYPRADEERPYSNQTIVSIVTRYSHYTDIVYR